MPQNIKMRSDYQSTTSTSKRSACDRCRRQKLGCEKQHEAVACNRCIRLNKSCVMSFRPPSGPLARRIPLSLRSPDSTSITTSTTARTRLLSLDGSRPEVIGSSTSPVSWPTTSSSTSHSVPNDLVHVGTHASQDDLYFQQDDYPLAIPSYHHPPEFHQQLPLDFDINIVEESLVFPPTRDSRYVPSSLGNCTWGDGLGRNEPRQLEPETVETAFYSASSVSTTTEENEGDQFPSLAEDDGHDGHDDHDNTQSADSSTDEQGKPGYHQLAFLQEFDHQLPMILLSLSKRSQQLRQSQEGEQELESDSGQEERPVSKLLADTLDDMSNFCDMIRPYYYCQPSHGRPSSRLNMAEMLTVVSAYLQFVNLHDTLLGMLHNQLGQVANKLDGAAPSSMHMSLDEREDQDDPFSPMSLESIFPDIWFSDWSGWDITYARRRRRRRRETAAGHPSSRSPSSGKYSGGELLWAVRLRVRMLMEDVLYHFTTTEALLGLPADLWVLEAHATSDRDKNKSQKANCSISPSCGVLNNEDGRRILAALTVNNDNHNNECCCSSSSCSSSTSRTKTSTNHPSSIMKRIRAIHGLLDTGLFPLAT